MGNLYKINHIEDIILSIRKLAHSDKLHTKQLDKSHQVSVPQLLCLRLLLMNGPMPISKIAENLLVKSSTITGVVDRLEKKGMVTRERIGKDRRVITIQLTDNGKKVAESEMSPVHNKIASGLSNLAPKDLKLIAGSLNKLVAMLEDADTQNFL